jgi:hypothetical protein
VLAHEANRPEEFQNHHRKALDLLAEANKIGPNNAGVHAITGGIWVVMADRLPKEYRATAWSTAYDSYRMLWKFQAAMVERMPLHLKGELLAGLAQTAQRTGRAEETNEYLDRIVALLPNTAYEPIAKRWKANPDVAAKGSITCLSCHDSGRLAARIDALK